MMIKSHLLLSWCMYHFPSLKSRGLPWVINGRNKCSICENSVLILDLVVTQDVPYNTVETHG